MSNFRLKVSHIISKKVPALSLLLVASLGMVLGVLAASLTITNKGGATEEGTYHNATGTITSTDNGLSVNANSIVANASTALTWSTTRTLYVYYSATSSSNAGDWVDSIDFTTSLTDSSTHTVTVTIRNGAGAIPPTLVAFTTAIWTGPGSASSQKVSVFVDLGTQSITAPLTVYISVS